VRGGNGARDENNGEERTAVEVAMEREHSFERSGQSKLKKDF
jgi:hypothetical protein